MREVIPLETAGKLREQDAKMAMAVLSYSSVAEALFSGDAMSHVRTAAYFASFLGCLFIVLHHFPWRSRAALVMPYSLAALVCTWRLILLFFVEHTQRYAVHPDPPNLFVEAYVLVCDAPAGWWWTNILLLWVTVACPMVHAEATRRGMPPSVVLAYIIVAFLGAVSLAFPLLLAHLLTLPTTPRKTSPAAAAAADAGVNAIWWPACIIASLLSIGALPCSVSLSRPIFILALVIVHVVLALPFMRAARAPRSPSEYTSVLGARGYRLLAFTSALLHAGSTVMAALSLGDATSAPMHAGSTVTAALSLGDATSAPSDVGSRLWELIGLLGASFHRNVCAAYVQPQFDGL